MKIVIPVENGKLSEHFGKCSTFALFENNELGELSESLYTAPPHEPGSIPRWIVEDLNASVVISNSLGKKAMDILTASNVIVVQGAALEEPKSLAEHYLEGTLETTAKSCCQSHSSLHNCL